MSTARVLAFCALLITGCRPTHSLNHDSGAGPLDASLDAGHDEPDAAEEPRDGGKQSLDAGEQSRDAGEPVLDAGEQNTDAGEPVLDAGDQTHDAGDSDAAPNDDHQPPAIDSADTATFTAGAASSFTIQATGTPKPSIAVSGTLPQGVSFTDHEDGTGEVSGTPGAEQGGSYALTITADNGVTPNATQAFTLVVLQAPALTNASSGAFQVGEAGQFTFTTTGYPAVTTITSNGTLPDGVTFTDQGDGSASLSGTPSAGQAGSYSLAIEADNGVDPAATLAFTLNVNDGPAITSAGATTFRAVMSTVDFENTFDVQSTGYPAPALTLTGGLPDGVDFVDHGDGSASLSGTPFANTGGSYALELSADNGIGTAAVQAFTLTVVEAPNIVSDSYDEFSVGASGTYTFTATGYPSVSDISLSGSLPSGVTFMNGGSGSAMLAGTPADGSGGLYPLQFTADNGVTPADSHPFNLIVLESPSFLSADQAMLTAGASSSFEVETDGYPRAALQVSGTLPAGVQLTDHGDGTATLGGSVGANAGGVYSLTLQAANQVDPDASQPFTLTVLQAPGFTSANTATFAVGSSDAFEISASGYPTAAIGLTGSLPTGLQFVDNGDGTAAISGTAAAMSGGSYPVQLSGTNGVNPAASQTLTLTVNEALAFTSANTTTFTAGAASMFSVEALGYPSVTDITVSGALPSGVMFSYDGAGVATLSGTPAPGSGGSFPIQLTAENGGSSTDALQSFVLVVNEAPTFTSASSATFVARAPSTFTLQASGYPVAMTFALTSGTLPNGVTLSTSGVLSGTPAADSGGTYPLTISASNGIDPDATQSFTLTVEQAPAFSSTASATFRVGTPGSFQVTGTGYPADFTVTNTGATLPSGVTLTPQGLLSGTPAPATGGTYVLALSLNNGVEPAGSQTFTLTVEQAPVITSAAAATFRVGSAGTTFLATATGYPLISSFQVSPPLPSGLTFTDNGDGTATFAGTPAMGTGGVYSRTITVSNGVNPDAQQSFALTIEEAPAFTSTAAATFPEDEVGTFTLTASGQPAPTFTNTGTALPAGITLASNGVLSGTATDPGTFNLEFTASNGISPDAVQSFVLTVEAPKVGITGVSPDPMIPGQSATLTGRMFEPSGNAVTVNGVTAKVTSVVDANSIVIRVPCLPSGTVAVVATNTTGTSTAFNASLQASAHALAVGDTLAPANAADSECTELSATNSAARYLINVFSVSTSPSSNSPYVFSGYAPNGLLGPDTINVPDTLPPPLAAADTDGVEGREALPDPSGMDEPELDANSVVPPLVLGPHPADPEIELAEAADAAVQHAELLEANARAFEELATEFVADPRMQRRPPDTVAFDVVAPPATRTFRLPNPTVGAICTTFQTVNATRVYYSGKFAIYEDDATPDAFKASLNPAMQTNYDRIGDQFNADMEPILRANFGDPLLRDAVTDNNGVVIMLTTPKINNSFSGYSGYTTTCDQFPNDEGAGNTNTSSNFGEIFYSYQPVVNATGYSGNTPDNWYRTIRASLIHEVKHIVSFAARVANNAAQYESGWLEEGTARLAEELWARQAVDVLPWKANNPYGSQMNPVGVYCDLRPSGYPECDASNTRRPVTIMQRFFVSLYTTMFGSNMRLLSPFGATASDNASYYYAEAWSLVRYTLDRYASDEAAFLTQLTGSTSTGLTNLLAAAGDPDLTEVLGGWAMAFAADDYPGFASAPSSSQQPTWNFRDIYAGLNTDVPGSYTLAYPQVPTALTFGTFNATAISTLRGGGALFYALSGTQNAAQSLWVRTSGDTAPNANLRIRILRVE